MRIIDLSSEYNKTYFRCLEEWSDEMKESGSHKETWFEKFKDKGLRVKLAQEDDGKIIGMIQYLPAELTFVTGGYGYYLIKCIWVHGHKGGVGNQQKRGVGTALLEACEQDCAHMNLKGILAWGVSLPLWMRAAWFKKHGYAKIDKDRTRVLMFKPFIEVDTKPQLIRKKKNPENRKDKVKITIFKNGWCSANNIVLERTLKVIPEFKDMIDVDIFDTTEPTVLEEWGIYEGIYINGKLLQKGPPPSYDKIYKRIKKEVKKCM